MALTWDGLGCPFCRNDGSNVEWALNAATEWLEGNEVSTGRNHCPDCGRDWKEYFRLVEAVEIPTGPGSVGETIFYDPTAATGIVAADANATVLANAAALANVGDHDAANASVDASASDSASDTEPICPKCGSYDVSEALYECIDCRHQFSESDLITTEPSIIDLLEQKGEQYRLDHPEEFCEVEVPDENNLGEPCGNPLPCPDHPEPQTPEEEADALYTAVFHPEQVRPEPEAKAPEAYAWLPPYLRKEQS